MWDETCSKLFTYLLIMSFLCIAGVIVYLYLGIVKYGSDTQWLFMSALGAVSAISLSLYLCSGVMALIEESGLFGAYQCYGCLDRNGTAVNGTCDVGDVCDPTTWKVIYSENDCANATTRGISCQLSELCINSATQTYWYALVATGFYILVLLLNAVVIFTKLIPSLAVQSGERSRLI